MLSNSDLLHLNFFKHACAYSSPNTTKCSILLEILSTEELHAIGTFCLSYMFRRLKPATHQYPPVNEEAEAEAAADSTVVE